MAKSAEAFRTISEVADDLGIPKHVLRFWEVKFAQIRPMKRGGGRRYYRPEDLELLKGIQHLLHREGYTIKGVQKILREQGVDGVKSRGRAMPREGAGDAVPAPEAPATTSGPVRAPASGAATSAAGRTAAKARAGALASSGRQEPRKLIETAIGELEAVRAILKETPQATHQRRARRAGGDA